MHRWCATARMPPIIRARLAHGDRRVLLEVQLNRQGANKARVNGAPVKPAELPRHAQVVLFAPEDLQIVRGDPSLAPPVRRPAARPAHPAARRRARRLRPRAQAAHRPAEVGEGARHPRRRALDPRCLGRQARRLGTRGHRGAPRPGGRARRADRRLRTRRSPAPTTRPEIEWALSVRGGDPEEGADMPMTDAAPTRIRGPLPRSARRAPRRRARPGSHARRPAPRRPRAARARPAGQGLRLARRVLVGRARAATRIRRAAARGVAARRPGAHPRRRLRRTRRRSPLAAGRARRRITSRSSSPPPSRRMCRRRCAPAPCASRRARSWRRRMSEPGARSRGPAAPGAVDESARVPETIATYLRLRGLEPSARSFRKRRRRYEDDENAPVHPGSRPARRRRCALGPHPRGGLGHAARPRGRRPRVGRGGRRGHRARTPGPVAFSEGTLTVQADSTAWAKQLQLMRAHILSEIVRRFPDAGCPVIRFIGPDVPSWKWGPRTIPGRGPRDTYG